MCVCVYFFHASDVKIKLKIVYVKVYLFSLLTTLTPYPSVHVKNPKITTQRS